VDDLRLGRYELISRIGFGGMAEVWRARPTSGGEKEVAVKVLLPAVADDAAAVELFMNEARLSLSLRHANIVPTIDYGFAGGRYFLAMELIDGTTLRRLPRLDLALAIFVVTEVAAALDHAYQTPGPQGAPLRIVHRDVNPTNVMVSADGRVQLADFGIARSVDRSAGTAPDPVKGKVHYMSPEQAMGLPIDGRSDLYALGLLLYELALGERAIGGHTTHETLRRAQSGARLPAGHSLPAPVADLVTRLWSLDPALRPATASEVREALLALLPAADQRDFTAELKRLVAGVVRPMSPSAPARATSRGHARWPWVLGVGLLLCAAGVLRWSAAVAPAALVLPTVTPALPSTKVDAPPPALEIAVPAPTVLAKRTPRRLKAAIAGTLRIEVVPWAQVWLDGRALGTTPLHPEQVEAGEHTVRVEHPELGSRKETFLVAAGEARVVSFNLTGKPR
jgi:serine/threonine-protein kinase